MFLRFKTIIFLAALAAFALSVSATNARICPQCGRDHLPNDTPKQEKAEAETFSAATIQRARFSAPSVEIADAADKILDRLEDRYGKPKTWRSFPIYFERYRGDGVAGYTLYQNGIVARVVCYEQLETATGGTLDHELTHAFFFYFLNSNFDLFINEGLAQNSEYRRRESLRETVYKRYTNGDFWDVSKLYGRNEYDGGLRIYHEGFSVVDYLIARGGSRWFAAFVDELTKTDRIDATLKRYYGIKSIEELQRSWKNYIENGQDRASVKSVK